MKILHVTPTYFGDESYIGGGERYPYELAKAMSNRADVTYLTFSDQSSSSRDQDLLIEYVPRSILFKKHPLLGNPFSPTLIQKIYWADVIHCYQAHTLVTDMAITIGRLFRKKVFVTDLGGGHRYAPSGYLPILKWPNGFLLISDYSRNLWREFNSHVQQSMKVIYGGVDTEKFSPGNSPKTDLVLFVGRLLPHKGIDYLIDAMENTFPLSVVGRVYNQDYFHFLKQKSNGKKIQFETQIEDTALVERYRSALVTVLPSVYRTCYGDTTRVPELLGLVVLESMSCGTPVIVSDVASLPELVQDGVTGFVVPPNDPKAIQEKIHYLQSNRSFAVEMGKKGREFVLNNFQWNHVVEKCLDEYCSVKNNGGAR
jgi:glycosyltransferase involved in cell wall biosynthesis